MVDKYARDEIRTGYVLLMVLVLLVVLATALSSIATRSMRTTQEAVVAVAQLQQRVGLESCQKTFLLQAEFVFKKMDEMRRNGQGPASPEANRMVADAITLGEQRFDLVLFDENAKVNLNTLNQNAGQQEVMKVLRETLPASIARTIAFHPAQGSTTSPTRTREPSSASNKGQEKSSASGSNLETGESEAANDPPMIPAFRSWGEVFDFGMLIGQSPEKQVQLEFAKSFTLWGSGQINIYRATDSQIMSLLGTVVPTALARKIVTKLKESPDPNIDTILEKEVESPKNRKQLRALLSPTSFAFSLFIDVDTPQCRSRKMFVNTLDSSGVQQILEFVFH